MKGVFRGAIAVVAHAASRGEALVVRKGCAVVEWLSHYSRLVVLR
jgi:hypothetical protein